MTIGIIWLPFIVIIAVFTGFFFRTAQISKFRKRVIELENEMLRNHAEILKLQQEMATMEKEYSLPHKSRVVPMKEIQQEGNIEKPDASQLKKSNK